MTAGSTNYTTPDSIVSGAGVNAGHSLGHALRADTALATDDPGNMTLNEAAVWAAILSVVRPAAAAGGLSIPIAAYHYNHHLKT
jgi:hypothetical protein